MSQIEKDNTTGESNLSVIITPTIKMHGIYKKEKIHQQKFLYLIAYVPPFIMNGIRDEVERKVF